MDRDSLIALAYDSFSDFPKPVHSTNFSHCEECLEYDELLKDVSCNDLTIEQIGTVCWGPVPFLLPEALGYYMPKLIEFAVLNVDNKDREPFVTQFINQIGDGPSEERYFLFKDSHRKAVYEAFRFIDENYREVVDYHCWADDLDLALQRWEI